MRDLLRRVLIVGSDRLGMGVSATMDPARLSSEMLGWKLS